MARATRTLEDPQETPLEPPGDDDLGDWSAEDVTDDELATDEDLDDLTTPTEGRNPDADPGVTAWTYDDPQQTDLAATDAKTESEA